MWLMLCKARKKAPIAIYAVLEKKKKTGLDKKKKKAVFNTVLWYYSPVWGRGLETVAL